MRPNLGITHVCLSLPTVVNRSGIKEVLLLDLDPTEVDMPRKSADMLKANIAGLKTEKDALAS
jgi:malate/lactate dehydrogenase